MRGVSVVGNGSGDFSFDDHGLQGTALEMLKAARKKAELKFGDG